MSEYSSQDRLQPALLDRLTDLQPQQQSESRDQRVISQRQLRRAVVRDLEWLLNTGHYSSVGDLTDYPWVARSVLNYGVPDLTGSTVSSVDLSALESELRAAIVNFEPRINRNNIEVTGNISQDTAYHNAVIFEISAEVWGDPAPVYPMLKTTMDLETGQVSVQDFGA